jgi:hypothetical protein
MKALDDSSARLKKLDSLIHTLEGGFTAMADYRRPMFIPSGWLHAVITIRGGPMFATNFMTSTCGHSLLRWTRMSPSKIDSYDHDTQRGLAENIIEQFSVTLQSPSDCVQILRYWIDSAESIARRLLTITYKRQLSTKIRTFLKGEIWASVRDIEVEKRLRESLRFLDKK